MIGLVDIDRHNTVYLNHKNFGLDRKYFAKLINCIVETLADVCRMNRGISHV